MTDYDAIVIGGGHNGLVTAAYLARDGRRTLLVEARATIGGTAASEEFAGATVNICNCDHLTFRTTPVFDELRLGDHGLVYVDLEPAQHNLAWTADGTTSPPWTHHHDLDATLDSIGRHFPNEVGNYRRYVETARPVIEMIFDAAAIPPTWRSLTGVAVRRRLAGTPTLLRWSKRSATDVLRSFFTTEAIAATAALAGPMVWGIGPSVPGSGLGALTHAMRHVATVGRPIGGSGRLPDALSASFRAAGGEVRTSARVGRILCGSDAVRAVRLTDGTEITADVVVSACDPHSTFVDWLTSPPPGADAMIERWRRSPHVQGYESKIDAVLDAVPRLRALRLAEDGADLGPTTLIAPPLSEIDRGDELIDGGRVLDRPGFLANVPTLVDPSMAPNGRHVLSLEVLFTPYRLGGSNDSWKTSDEPLRWLELFAAQCEPGLLDSIIEWRAMTPDVYERDFHLPAGRAASFAGGPVAALRNSNPELTRYETAVPGLYITGAATFPGAGIWGASGRNCAAVVLGRG